MSYPLGNFTSTGIDDNATSTAITIDSAQRVGLGTDNMQMYNVGGGNSTLVVTAISSATNVLANTDSNITIANGDGTADNTAALHFAREDTDGAPNYVGASIVSQFKETQVTGQYPKADLAFLTSTAANTAPSEKMRINSAGNVGIGTASPTSKLHVSGGAGSTIRNTATSGSSWFVGSNIDAYILHNESNSPMLFTTNGTERMRIDSAGIVTMPYQPAFSVHLSTGQSIVINTPTTLLLDDEEFDVGNNFNSSTHKFTAPVAGRYLFTAAIQYNAIGAAHTNIYVNGVSFYDGWMDFGNASASTQSRVLHLSTGDYVELVGYIGTTSSMSANRCRLTGYLLG